ncbi:MAG: YicC/YloC family endoribonuclease [Rhizobiaceae bacterium]
MAIESMTGFARHEQPAPGGGRLVCEIRSVNGKSLDVRFKLPNGQDRLEPQLRQLVQAKIARGNLQISLSHDGQPLPENLQINHGLVEQILTLAASLKDRHGLDMPSVGELLSVRGVLDNTASEDSAELEVPALAVVSEACDELKRFRAREGEAIKALLKGQVASIESLAARAFADPSRSAEMIRERLAGQVRLLIDSVQGFDETRLTAEAALLATKADIREELDRLNGHVAVARQLLEGEGPVGRKLDFLAQEFNREANTLCSKSNAASITAIGLELKTVVDQFREQVQNLE